MQKVLVGEVLAPPLRQQLIAWMQSESQQPVSALDQAHAEIGGLFAAAVARQ